MNGSLDEVFLVLVHVALQDVLDRAQQSLEGVSLDGDNAAVGLCLNAGLPDGVLDQSDFSEVVAFLVLKDLLDWGSGRFLLFCDESALGNDVEAVSLVTLLHDVAASCELLFLEAVAKLLLLVGVDLSQDLHLGEDFRVVFAFFGGGLLHDVVEGGTVEAEQLARSLALDGGGTRGVVHEGQLSEEVTSVVGLEVGLLAGNDLEAVELSLVDDVQSVSLFALSDHCLCGLGVHFLHGVDDDAEVFLVERLEEDGLLDESLDFFFGGCVLGDDFLDELGLLVELSEHLSADALPRVLLLHLLLFLLFQLPQELRLHFFAFFV